MRLESALYASREGLQAHGQAISVIGDNVSNANTIGFKRSRIEFADLFADGEGQKSSPPEGQGGSGVKTARVRQLFEGGLVEATGRITDIAVEGNGFFIVGDADNPSYTRAGNFTVNEAGKLVSADGLTVLGYQGNSTTLSALDLSTIPTGGTATTTLSQFGNLDARSGIRTAPNAPTSFRDLRATSDFMAEADVFDSLGTPHTVQMAFTKTGLNTWAAQAYVDGGRVTGGTAGVPSLIGQTTLTFGNDGVIAQADKAGAVINATPAWVGGAAAGAFKIDVGNWTQFSAAATQANVSQDGQGVGNISTYRFDKKGGIFAVLDTGIEAKIGSIVLGDVPNRDGLIRSGNSTLKPGDDSGEVTLGTPGSGKFGTVVGGSLERSTVDIATEFVDLVLYQRGYQASSQTFTTVSSIIKDTLSLIR